MKMTKCECGCSQLINRFDSQGRERRFVNGHNSKGIKLNKKTKDKIRESKIGIKNLIKKPEKIMPSQYIQIGQRGRCWGKIGLTITCMLQSRYQNQAKRVKSASVTVHVEEGITPKDIINYITDVIKNSKGSLFKNRKK